MRCIVVSLCVESIYSSRANVPPPPFFYKNGIPKDLGSFLRQEYDSKSLSSNTSPRAEASAGKASDGIRDGARFPSSQSSSIFYFTPRVKALARLIRITLQFPIIPFLGTWQDLPCADTFSCNRQ